LVIAGDALWAKRDVQMPKRYRSVLLHCGGTVEDRSRLDLADAPPFSLVWAELIVPFNQAW
jgi:hypothetical protein